MTGSSLRSLSNVNERLLTWFCGPSSETVCSGERLEILKVISNPHCVSPEFDSTFTSWTASITARGAGIGTPGPIRSWRRTGSAITVPRDVLGQRDPQRPADRLREVARVYDAVRVGEAPPELRVAEMARREHVAPVASRDPHLVQQRESLRARAEPSAQERHRRLARAWIPRVDTDGRVAARRRQRRRRDGACREQFLQ